MEHSRNVDVNIGTHRKKLDTQSTERIAKISPIGIVLVQENQVQAQKDTLPIRDMSLQAPR